MKKLITLALALIMALGFTSCAKNADVDLMNKSNIYNDLAKIIGAPNDYKDKTVLLRTEYTVVYNFSENKIARHTMLAFDKTGTKRALYEVRDEEGNYPTIGAIATVSGTFRDGKYIEVNEFKDTSFDKPEVDVDALDMTADELKTFIEEFSKNYNSSESYGKTIRIFGHCIIHESYKYLTGLAKDGALTWNIELYDHSGSISYPSAEGNNTNPIEVIGKLTIYFEDNLAYACIEVEKVTPVQSTLS